ncbi:MAG: hypothetical protein ACC656_09485 [Candidatus Heimdallarchaeota archaeon]
MKLVPSDSTSESTIDTNSSHHIHTKHPHNNLGLPKEMKEELFKAIAKNEARRILQKASLSEIAKYLDSK